MPRRADEVDDAVVEAEERGVQPGDDQVLVVARVGDDRGPVGVRGTSSNSPPLSIRSFARSAGSYSCGEPTGPAP